MIKLGMLIMAFAGSFLGTFRYHQFAIQRRIIAHTSFRSLHDRVVPRGGGIVFASVFSLAIVVCGALGELTTGLVLIFGVGGGAAALVGFLDDVYDVRASHKLLTQVGLATWIFAVFYQSLYAPLFRDYAEVLAVVLAGVLLFVPVWLINLYNFIDGIDGLAVSGCVVISAAAMVVLAMTGGDGTLIFVFALLIAACLGFLIFNVPPASIFMGDSGSIFLGYCLSALAIKTVISGQISLWTWLAIMGYFIADTTTTTVTRMFLVKRWYGVHRSHAYQNLARIHVSHARVTYGIAAYNIGWALPLAVWSALRPEQAPAAALLSLAPAVLWTLRFGPLLSSV